MIYRAIIPILLAILLGQAYLDYRYARRGRLWQRLLGWLPSVGMAAYAVKLASVRNFLPDDAGQVNRFLFLFGLLVVPQLVFALCSLLGSLYCRLFKKRRNYGVLVGLVAVLAVWYVLFYGTFVGFSKLEVRHVEFASPDLPASFDGYRIVQFSDAHVGTYTGSRQAILQRAVDSINAQRADMIVFTGDLQNTQPRDIYPHRELLARLKAKDGVYSVLGNHDYADYIDADEYTKYLNCGETVALEREMGWTPLNNSHRTIRRGDEQIVIAGMENDGEGRFPQRGVINRALYGLQLSDFVVMLEHDPTSWRRKILPHSHTQLTLSGHTHAMQLELFGWSPVSLRYREYDGLYRVGPRALFVSKGLGGVIPFRFGATGEIVVITLRKS